MMKVHILKDLLVTPWGYLDFQKTAFSSNIRYLFYPALWTMCHIHGHISGRQTQKTHLGHTFLFAATASDPLTSLALFSLPFPFPGLTSTCSNRQWPALGCGRSLLGLMTEPSFPASDLWCSPGCTCMCAHQAPPVLTGLVHLQAQPSLGPNLACTRIGPTRTPHDCSYTQCTLKTPFMCEKNTTITPLIRMQWIVPELVIFLFRRG